MPRFMVWRTLSRWTAVTSGNGIRSFCEMPIPRQSSRIKQRGYGVLLDIDGVLVRGRKAIPGAREALEILHQSDVPTVFLTNAGCESEKLAAERLSDKIGFEVKEGQMVLSHTPLKMCEWLYDKHILLSGQGPVKEILNGYGFTNVSDMEDARRAYPLLDMVDRTRRYQFAHLCQTSEEFPPVEAIILLGEPVRWETNLQLIVDFLMTSGNPSASSSSLPKKDIPVIATNTDLLYVSESPLPRFGHGAFLHCLESIYKKLTGQDLNYSLLLGKPYLTNYHYAESSLNKINGSKTSIKAIYAVGDNLDTDIYGANMCQEYLQAFHEQQNTNLDNWKQIFCSQSKQGLIPQWIPEVKRLDSILVQTGVSSPSNNSNPGLFLHRDTVFNPKLRKANHVTKNVVEAVELILQQESNR